MEFEQKNLDPRANKGSVSKDTKEMDIMYKGISNRNTREINVPPSSIFGTQHRPPSNENATQKQYKEATERFIHAYQSYEKTRAFLEEARETGDLRKIDHFILYYIKSKQNLMNAIHAMDKAKSNMRINIINKNDNYLH